MFRQLWKEASFTCYEEQAHFTGKRKEVSFSLAFDVSHRCIGSMLPSASRMISSSAAVKRDTDSFANHNYRV